MQSDTSSALDGLAGSQHGAISAAQLRGLGLSRSLIHRWTQVGRLRRVAPQVYVVVGSPDSVERRLHVGLLTLGPAAVVSHEAAARLHQFDRSPADAVEFTVPREQRGRVRGRPNVHTTDRLGPLDRVVVAGFPVTSATRTIIDLARAGVSRPRLEAAIDSAVRSGATAPVVLARRLSELRGCGLRNARRLDALLPDSGGHTPLERAFLRLVREAGLPRPVTQVVHRQGSRTIARVDFVFEEQGFVVEVSGRLGHASDAERARDAQRRNELQDIGRRVYEYTRRDVEERPQYVLETLQARLGGLFRSA